MNDYVARSLAEAATSEVSCAITLTYAPRDDLADKVLLPRHFQLFMKLLRRSGHKVRYLVAGEYGDQKGRAHFHALLFFQHLADIPGVPGYNPAHLHDPESSERFSGQIPHKRMVHIREWPHGHVNLDWSFSDKSARYVCKYLLKEDKQNAWFSLSKKPALGAAWFAARAEKARELGVLPSSFEYLPPGGDKSRRYMMTGATRRDYLAALAPVETDRPRMSEWVGKTYDKHALAARVADLEAQPVEVIDEAYRENRQRLGEQAGIARKFSDAREVERLDAMSKAFGPLVKVDGEWRPWRVEHERS
ncbi:rolling circle replication-associated protein [Paracoccus pacificus]|uniref:Replication-associated protein ORF2/G2P domain-containing protein n=1 Tax=Paracoccus pacificus TaxID=1463598 RepID=A0ABW4R4D7_9RHOB